MTAQQDQRVPTCIHDYVTYHMPTPKPTPRPNQKVIHFVGQSPPRRSIRTQLSLYNRANSAMLVKQDSLYEFISNAMAAPKIFIPRNIKSAKLAIDRTPIDLQEFC